jgi:sigma-B regulation protein RsbU (phosphoserine phosphatase)
VLDVPTGKVTLASAGHCPPIHLSNRSQFIDLVGYPLGIPALVRPPTPYRVVHLTLAPGDRLVLYSDGVVEAQNAKRNFFDDDRFVRCLEQASIDQTPTDLIADLVTDVKSFIGNARRTDDITLVILQRDLSLNP